MTRRSSCLLVLALVLSIAPLQLHAQRTLTLQQAEAGFLNADKSTARLTGFTTGTPLGAVGGLVAGLVSTVTGAGSGTLVNGVQTGQVLNAVMELTGASGESLGTVPVQVGAITSGVTGRKMLQQACPPIILLLERTPTAPGATVDGVTINITSTPGGTVGELLCLVGRLLAPVGGLINLTFVAKLLSQLLGNAGLGLI